MATFPHKTMRQKRQSRFAYGQNTVEACPCPATAAGMNPDNAPVGRIAEQYDEIVRDKEEEFMGTIDREQAKEAWNEAIRIAEEKRQEANKPMETGMWDESANVGRNVSDELNF